MLVVCLLTRLPVPCVGVRVVDAVGVEGDDSEAVARSRRAVERRTRGAKAVSKVLLERIAYLLSPLKRE